MGYKYNGGTARSVGFEYQTNRPGDERDIVNTFDDLLTIPNVYRLIEVKVDDEGGTKYIWNGLNQADPDNWTVTGGGEKGADGADGATGATGPAGPQGIQGDQGDQGIQGIKGDTGDQGEKGDTGADGSSIVVEGTDTVSNILAKDPTTPNLLWIASDSGTDGVGAPVVPGDGLVSDGIEWINAGPIRGPQGEKGDTGDTGANGLDGAQGIQGDTGSQGPTGPTGLTGAKGDKGDTGEGIAIGGTVGQLLIKKTNTNYDTEWADNDAAQKSQSNTFGDYASLLDQTVFGNVIIKGASQSVDGRMKLSISESESYDTRGHIGYVNAVDLPDSTINNINEMGSKSIVTKEYAAASHTVGEPVGTTGGLNIVEISQVNYDAAETAGTLVATTLYVING